MDDDSREGSFFVAMVLYFCGIIHLLGLGKKWRT